MSKARGSILGLALACLTLPAWAQSVAPPLALEAEPVAEPQGLTPLVSGQPRRVIVFSAMLGVQANPAYYGSDDMIAGPSFSAALAQLRFAGIDYGNEEVQADPYQRRRGFAYGLSFRYVGPRNSGDYSQIDGLDDIDPTVELGAGVGYVWPNWEVLAAARYGIGGSDAWVGDMRLNYVTRPTDRLAIRVGPRAFFGSENYLNTYFGISSDESERSGLPRYDPDPGLVSVGLEAVATYQLTDRWWLEGAAKWSRFQNDAAGSPIVEEGSDDYTEFRIGFRRSFSLRF